MAGSLLKMLPLAATLENVPRDVYELEASHGISRSVEQGEPRTYCQASVLYVWPGLAEDENM